MTRWSSATARQIEAPRWRILIVDDYPASQVTTRHVLGLCGHICTSVERGDTALRAIDTFRPNAVVLEWNLRDGSGIGLSRALRERSTTLEQELAILIVSTADEPTGFRDQEDVDAYFTKPVSMLRVAEALLLLQQRTKFID